MNGILIPQTIYAGDTAQFLFLLPESELITMQQYYVLDTPLPLEIIEQNETMTIKDIRLTLRDKQPYLLITFVPWETGTLHFPSLTPLKMKTVLPSIHVASILKTTGASILQPPKPPLLMPGTDYMLYGSIIAAVVFTALLITTGILIIKRLKRGYFFRTGRKRMRYLRKTLKRLYKQAKKLQQFISTHKNTDVSYHTDLYNDINQWYGSIDVLMREYLFSVFDEYAHYALGAYKEKTHSFFLSATYSELMQEITGLFPTCTGVQDAFKELYVHLERYRFGYSIETIMLQYAASAAALLRIIPSIARTTETAYTKLRQKNFYKECENA